MRNAERILERITKWALLLTALTPLVFKKDLFFPYLFPKAVYFRGLIEIALAAALLFLAFSLSFRQPFDTAQGKQPKLVGKRIFRHPITLAIALFFVSLTVSTVIAPNSYRAFWGELERGEGLFGMLHVAAFFTLAAIFFKREDWRRYFKLSLVVAGILSLYAVLQFYGSNFPWTPEAAPRPGSLVGNAAFLAVHMLFVIVFAGIVSALSSSKGWRNAAYLSGIIATGVIFLTGTRGVILGLGAGVLVWLVTIAIRPIVVIPTKPRTIWFGAKAGIHRRLAIAALCLIVLGGGIFWMTRSAPLWQRVPGLDRLATTAVFDPNDPSTQTRIITWKASSEAFQEKPWLGWGPENYLYAWEQHYDPTYALYGETWLDRAHNKVFDLLVMQGVFGLAAYLLLLAALFWTLFWNNVPARRVIFAGVAAYLLQNLLLLDQLLSHMTFFALLAFVVSESGEQMANGKWQMADRSSKIALPLAICPSLFAIGLGYVFYAYNAVPFLQSRAMRLSAERGKADLAVESLRRATSPYNYAQMNIRGQGIDSIYLNGYFYRADYRRNPAFKEIGDILLASMKEVGDREPFDARTMIRQAEMLDAMGADDPARYKEAEAPLRVAVEITPLRQEVWYQLAVNLAKQGRKEEAVEAARHAIDLQAGVARAHFHYALVLAMTGEHGEAEIEIDRALELDPDMSTFLGGDHNTVVLIYRVTGRPQKIIDLAMQSVRGELGARRFAADTYQLALHWYKDQRDKDAILAIARFLVEDPALKDEMEVILDLAAKDMWETIWKL